MAYHPSVKGSGHDMIDFLHTTEGYTMYAQLTFNVVDDIGTFHLPELAAAPYYELLRSYLADAMSDQAFCAALRELHQQEPQCLEVIASLTGGLAATLPSNALAYADKGLALTAGLIPRRFNGTIPWEHPGNKAFYRLLFAAALANSFPPVPDGTSGVKCERHLLPPVGRNLFPSRSFAP